jgi:hypothetical protein
MLVCGSLLHMAFPSITQQGCDFGSDHLPKKYRGAAKLDDEAEGELGRLLSRLSLAKITEKSLHGL